MNLELDPIAHKNRRLLWWVLGGGALLLLLAAAGVFSSQLGARAIPWGFKPQITGPDKVTIGQKATITWTKNAANQRLYPNEKIELFSKATGQWVTLAGSVPNNGRATVNVPNNPRKIKPGDGTLRLIARNSKGELLTQINITRPVRIIQTTSRPTPAPKGDTGGGSGGGDSGGGGSGRDSSQPTPTPARGPSAEFVVPTDNEVVTANTNQDVRVKLIETTVNKLTCQQWILDGQPLLTSDWVSGQSPDLSAGACN